ncbi:hypothetical protein C8F04DRAFT_1279531 [Mycena alexandri]|uniref:Uncharacterized protein n=1 Tax=Mycena alexandri TaxID=1745969 RepID=A0AAD6WLX2_9AGAR|nr:hypothetical protein C8F04DRAFT_1279531 [Mycena alexandri]
MSFDTHRTQAVWPSLDASVEGGTRARRVLGTLIQVSCSPPPFPRAFLPLAPMYALCARECGPILQGADVERTTVFSRRRQRGNCQRGRLSSLHSTALHVCSGKTPSPSDACRDADVEIAALAHISVLFSSPSPTAFYALCVELTVHGSSSACMRLPHQLDTPPPSWILAPAPLNWTHRRPRAPPVLNLDWPPSSCRSASALDLRALMPPVALTSCSPPPWVRFRFNVLIYDPPVRALALSAILTARQPFASCALVVRRNPPPLSPSALAFPTTHHPARKAWSTSACLPVRHHLAGVESGIHALISAAKDFSACYSSLGAVGSTCASSFLDPPAPMWLLAPYATANALECSARERRDRQLCLISVRALALHTASAPMLSSRASGLNAGVEIGTGAWSPHIGEFRDGGVRCLRSFKDRVRPRCITAIRAGLPVCSVCRHPRSGSFPT